jgi:hypothetical protein
MMDLGFARIIHLKLPSENELHVLHWSNDRVEGGSFDLMSSEMKYHL